MTDNTTKETTINIVVPKFDPETAIKRDFDWKLGRFYKNLNVQKKSIKSITLEPPKTTREPKKTTWVNFLKIASQLNRDPMLLQKFVENELLTTTSIDGKSGLVIKGKFQPKNIEIIIKKFILNYVMCQACKDYNTVIEKQDKLSKLLCKLCNTQRTL